MSEPRRDPNLGWIGDSAAPVGLMAADASEVTPEMVDAGYAVFDYDDGSPEAEEVNRAVCERIFRAMLSAAPLTTHKWRGPGAYKTTIRRWDGVADELGFGALNEHDFAKRAKILATWARYNGATVGVSFLMASDALAEPWTAFLEPVKA